MSSQMLLQFIWNFSLCFFQESAVCSPHPPLASCLGLQPSVLCTWIVFLVHTNWFHEPKTESFMKSPIMGNHETSLFPDVHDFPIWIISCLVECTSLLSGPIKRQWTNTCHCTAWPSKPPELGKSLWQVLSQASTVALFLNFPKPLRTGKWKDAWPKNMLQLMQPMQLGKIPLTPPLAISIQVFPGHKLLEFNLPLARFLCRMVFYFHDFLELSTTFFDSSWIHPSIVFFLSFSTKFSRLGHLGQEPCESALRLQSLPGQGEVWHLPDGHGLHGHVDPWVTSYELRVTTNWGAAQKFQKNKSRSSFFPTVTRNALKKKKDDVCPFFGQLLVPLSKKTIDVNDMKLFSL